MAGRSESRPSWFVSFRDCCKISESDMLGSVDDAPKDVGSPSILCAPLPIGVTDSMGDDAIETDV